MNRVVGNLESGVPCIGKNETIELEIDKIADPGATETHQVMVMIGIAVEPGHRIRMVCFYELRCIGCGYGAGGSKTRNRALVASLCYLLACQLSLEKSGLEARFS